MARVYNGAIRETFTENQPVAGIKMEGGYGEESEKRYKGRIRVSVKV